MTYTRYVNGEIVEFTPAEIAARQAEEAAALTAQIKDHLEAYAKSVENSALTVQGFTEDGSEEHRRNAKEALDFVEELGSNAPSSLPWSSPNHGVQSVTPAVLRAWLLAAGLRRLKRFNVQAVLDPADYSTKEALETAFDAAMSSA